MIWLYSEHKLTSSMFGEDTSFTPTKNRPYESFQILDTSDRRLSKANMMLCMDKAYKLSLYRDDIIYTATVGKAFRLPSNLSELRKSPLKECVELCIAGEVLYAIAPVSLAVSTFTIHYDGNVVNVCAYRSANSKSGYLYKFSELNSAVLAKLEACGCTDLSFMEYCLAANSSKAEDINNTKLLTPQYRADMAKAAAKKFLKKPSLRNCHELYRVLSLAAASEELIAAVEACEVFYDCRNAMKKSGASKKQIKQLLPNKSISKYLDIIGSKF